MIMNGISDKQTIMLITILRNLCELVIFMRENQSIFVNKISLCAE